MHLTILRITQGGLIVVNESEELNGTRYVYLPRWPESGGHFATDIRSFKALYEVCCLVWQMCCDFDYCCRHLLRRKEDQCWQSTYPQRHSASVSYMTCRMCLYIRMCRMCLYVNLRR